MKLEALGDAPSFARLKCFVERAELVGVEVVQYQPDHLGIRVGLVHQPPHLVREVHGSAALGHLHMSPSTLRLADHEQVPGPVSLVLGVIACHPSGGSLDGRTHLPSQLPGGLVETHYRTLRIVLRLVQVQHVLHPRHELPAHLGDTPLFLLPGLEFVFLSIWRTVSREMLSANSNSTTYVGQQLECPVEACDLRARRCTLKAIRCASCRPSSLRSCGPATVGH